MFLEPPDSPIESILQRGDGKVKFFVLHTESPANKNHDFSCPSYRPIPWRLLKRSTCHQESDWANGSEAIVSVGFAGPWMLESPMEIEKTTQARTIW